MEINEDDIDNLQLKWESVFGIVLLFVSAVRPVCCWESHGKAASGLGFACAPRSVAGNPMAR